MEWIKRKLAKLKDEAKAFSIGEIFFIAVVATWGGVFPIPGVATPVTFGLFYLLLESKKFPVAIGFNMLATPFQIICIPIFGRIGGNLGEHLAIHMYLEMIGVTGVLQSIEPEKGSWLSTAMYILETSSAAFLGWLITTPAVIFAGLFVARMLDKLERAKKVKQGLDKRKATSDAKTKDSPDRLRKRNTATPGNEG